MLDFADLPYRYFPPKRSPLVVGLLGCVNRLHQLPRKDRIDRVEVAGAAELRAALKPGDRLVVCPNHATHSDAPIALEALRQAGLSVQIMAAYDVFLRSRLGAWVMQRFGSFSVDREGTDPEAMKEALRTVTEGRHALLLFPEGNVYLQNDLVTPFHDGAAFLALKGARDAKSGRVLLVPVAMKTTLREDVRGPLAETLARLSKAVDGPAVDGLALGSLRGVGLAALQRSLSQRGIPVPPEGELPARIRAAAETVLDRLEAKMGAKGRPGETPLERVRRARREIHQIRIDPERAADHAAASVWADEAMLAFRIASYGGDYVAARPTLDRFAETVEKIEEDLFRKTVPPCHPRRAYVRFGDPIDLAPHVEAFSKKARAAVSAVTEELERRVQAGLDALNAGNPHPGGKLLSEL